MNGEAWFVIVRDVTEDFILGIDAITERGLVIDGYQRSVYQSKDYQQAFTSKEFGLGPRKDRATLEERR